MKTPATLNRVKVQGLWPAFQFRVSLHAQTLVLFTLTWSYLFHPAFFPVPVPPFLKILFISAAIFILAWPYRALRYELNVSDKDAMIFFGYLAAFTLVNLRMLSQSIACDELYHAEQATSYLYALALLPESCRFSQMLKTLPMPVLSSYVSITVLVFGGLLVATYRWVSNRLSARGRSILLFLILLGIGCIGWKIPFHQEPHPPMRLLPLFVSQLVFGLQDFSFRFPGVIVMAAVAWGFWRLVREKNPDSPLLAWVVGAAVYFIPTVFHAAAIVEPSIWAFVTAVVVLGLLYQAERDHEVRFVVWAGLATGIGVLFRQNTLVLWPVVAFFALSRATYRKDIVWIGLPVLFVIPYLVTVVTLGHPVTNTIAFSKLFHKEAVSGGSLPVSAASADTRHILSPKVAALRPDAVTIPAVFNDIKPLRNLYASTFSGGSLRAVLRSTTLPWVLFLGVGMGILFFTASSRLNLFYLLLVSGYGLFFSLGPILRGTGRYQVEYIAPCIAAALLMLAIEMKSRWHAPFIALLAGLGSFSFFQNLTIPQDVHYDWWANKKISSESLYPYREALGFLQRQGSHGKFVIVGGVPVYDHMILWLRGFNWEETENYRKATEAYGEFLAGQPTALGFFEFMKKNDLSYFAVQYGDKRDEQHRWPPVDRLMTDLSRYAVQPPAATPFVRRYTFIGQVEGAIDVYARPAQTY